MQRVRRRLGLLSASCIVAAGAYSLLSWGFCRTSPKEHTTPSWHHATGLLSVGAARVEIRVPLPVVRAGYGPPHPSEGELERPLYVRAVVLKVRTEQAAIVSLELLTAPFGLVEELTSSAKAMGVDSLFVVATHTHSSLGGYDPNVVTEIAATGIYRPAVHRAVLAAATEAIRRAAQTALAASTSLAIGWLDSKVVSRSEGGVDSSLTRMSFQGPKGPIAQLIVFSAHPTLYPRGRQGLSPDYPGALSSFIEEHQGGIAVFLPGAVGNALAVEGPAPARPGSTDPKAWVDYGEALAQTAMRLKATPLEVDALGAGEIELPLPPPDSSRLLPSYLSWLGNTVLCASVPRHVGISFLRLGDWTSVWIPAEVTVDAANEIKRASGASALVSLSNGYLGYLDTPAHVASGVGEGHRQYFGPPLLDAVERAAQLLLEPHHS